MKQIEADNILRTFWQRKGLSRYNWIGPFLIKFGFWTQLVKVRKYRIWLENIGYITTTAYVM